MLYEVITEKALKAYKSVVERYPGTAEVGDALLGIKNIYVDMNNVDEYFAYAKQSGGVGDVSIAEHRITSYNVCYTKLLRLKLRM